MILDEVLNAQWSPYGVTAASAADAKRFHKFLREAVLDRHICTHKVIGFLIDSNVATRGHVGTYIARHMQIGESYPQMIVNLLDKVFLDIKANSAKCLLKTGLNTLDNNSFGDGRNATYEVLRTNPEICRCLFNETYLTVKLAYDAGYRSMQENSKELGGKYFPCYTDFSLSDFVRVLPMQPGSKLIPVRFYSGMTLDKFKQILLEWKAFAGTGGLRKEDGVWLQQSFNH